MTTISTSEKFGLGVLKLLGWVALLAASSVWRGYVLSILWGWFIVSAFGLPPLTIPLAIGVSLIVGFLTIRHTKEEQLEMPVRIWLTAAMPALVLLVGWVVTKFL
ncbi:hypothetical protein D3C87_1366730 [compost metagenome]